MNPVAYFDLESAPLPDDQLAKVKPVFEPYKNIRDPDKIAANIAEQERKWKEDAALDATTGKVVVIGVYEKQFECNPPYLNPLGTDLPEQDILAGFWQWCDEQLVSGTSVVGFDIFRFDLPFLIRRSWILGVRVPSSIRQYNRHRWDWHERFVDLARVWNLNVPGDHISLNTLAKSLGVGSKDETIGPKFYEVWATDRQKALDYIWNDLELTRLCYEKMMD